jgi:orotidine-5'-phosphate decarboxylase
MIKEKAGKDLIVVTPGVRPVWAAAQDQKRITTPAQAIKEGADYLVIGRPVIRAEEPLDAIKRIYEEIGS